MKKPWKSWVFGWGDKAQCFRSVRRFGAVGSSLDFSRVFFRYRHLAFPGFFHDIWLLMCCYVVPSPTLPFSRTHRPIRWIIFLPPKKKGTLLRASSKQTDRSALNQNNADWILAGLRVCRPQVLVWGSTLWIGSRHFSQGVILHIKWPVRIRHNVHNFGWQSSYSKDLAG